MVNCTYFLNGKPLEQVSNFKYLGINVSDNFDWDVHIDSVTAKASQRLGMIKHVLFDAPRKVKRVAYLTLCRPILEYASEVWDLYLIRQITSLEDIQRKGVRFISGIRGRQSVTEARVCLKLDLLETRRKTALMNLMMQILTNQKHDALIQCFQKLQERCVSGLSVYLHH